MTREEARQVLDAARAGLDVPHELITLALLITGDLSPWRAQQMAQLETLH